MYQIYKEYNEVQGHMTWSYLNYIQIISKSVPQH